MPSTNSRKGLLVTATINADHINLLVAGEVNSKTSPVLERQISEVFLQDNCTKVVVSLEHVPLITSAGLRVLLLLARSIEEIRGQLSIYDCQPAVIDILKITGFDSLLNLTNSYDEAVFHVDSSVISGVVADSSESHGASRR